MELNEDMPILNFTSEWVDAKKGEVFRTINTVIAEWGRTNRQQNMASSLTGYQAYFNRKRPIRTTGGFVNITPFGPMVSPAGSARSISYFNLTAVIVDTLTAKLASIDITPQIATNKANSKGRKLADDLNYLLKGLFLKHDVSHQINDAFKRAMITRKAGIQVRVGKNDVEFETVRLEDVIVDPLDSYYNKPKKLVLRRLRSLQEMKLKYPKFAKELDGCAQLNLSVNYSHDNTPMLIETEAFCLNTYREKGRHTITVNNCDLVDEDWDKNYFPVLFVDYNEPLIGFTGESITDELEPLQVELNRLFQSMQTILRIVSVPRVFIDGNSDVNESKFTNIPGEIIKYNSANGLAPIIHNGAGMPPEIPAQIKALIEYAYSRSGLTSMDTQGQQMAGSGNQSGEALKTIVDIKSERWRYLEGLYEQAHINMASLLFKELKGKDFKVSVLDRHIGLKELSTKSIPNVDSSYIIQIYPVSSLPDGISDRIDSVERLMNLGLITKDKVYDLFKLPDVESEVAKISAPSKIVDKVLDDIVETKKYQYPEPYYDIDYALIASKREYCWAKMQKDSEEVQKLLRRFINDTIALIKERDAMLNPQAPSPATANMQGTQSTVPQAPAGVPATEANQQPIPGVLS